MEKKFLSLFVMILFVATGLLGQNKQYLNLSIGCDILPNHPSTFGYGIAYEKQFAKHHGVILQMNYRNVIMQNSYNYPDINSTEIISSKIRVKYISVPIRYKFYSDIVNASAGFTFDYYIGWEDEGSKYPVTALSIWPKLTTGCIVSLSKTLKFTDYCYLEPEFKFNPMFTGWWSPFYALAANLRFAL